MTRTMRVRMLLKWKLTLWGIQYSPKIPTSHIKLNVVHEKFWLAYHEFDLILTPTVQTLF